MFMDIDAKINVDLVRPADFEHEFAIGFCKLAQAQAQVILGKERPFSLVVCTRSNAGGRKPKKINNKIGLHLVWTDWIVDVEQALKFRSVLVDACEKHFGGTFGFLNKWSDIADASVYKGSGLRMIGTRKNNGEGYVYLPEMEVSSSGEVTHCAAPWEKMAQWVHRTSIREGDTEKAVTSSRDIPDIQPKLVQEEDEMEFLRSAGTNRKALSMITMDAACKDLLRDVCAATRVYSGAKITRVYSCKTRGNAPAFVIGTDSKKCANKASGQHSSNHIYLVLEEQGLFQKCFCRCDTTTGRKFGRCSDFKHKILPFMGCVKLCHRELGRSLAQ
jgi:hypothetical protein